jgi:hypothetical protein
LVWPGRIFKDENIAVFCWQVVNNIVGFLLERLFMENVYMFLDGKLLYGDDFNAHQIEEWFAGSIVKALA